jgi:chaperonin GroES
VERIITGHHFCCSGSAREEEARSPLSVVYDNVSRSLRHGKNRPVGDRVAVKPSAKEEVTRSGIIIPDTAKEKPQRGTVVAIGSGRLLENGHRAALDVCEGNRVLFAKYGGTEFKLEGEAYLVLKEHDILAIPGED